MSEFGVRRAKTALSSGCKPHPATAPAGPKTDSIPGGVSHWFKQDEIHDSTHVHFCPAFLPWHRELVNRFEAMLREIDPQLSLHYWDWTQDPTKAPDGQGGCSEPVHPRFHGQCDRSGRQRSRDRRALEIRGLLWWTGPIPRRHGKSR
jgi:Common central domain of tyrosinase